MERYPVPPSRPCSTMRCRLQSTRLLRSETAYRRSTTSGPGRCSRSFAILGFLKLSRDSALSPRSCAIDVICFPVFVFSLVSKGKCRVDGLTLTLAVRRRPKQRRAHSIPIHASRHTHLRVHVRYSFCFWNAL